jgi:preprotein translocase subunit YajC
VAAAGFLAAKAASVRCIQARAHYIARQLGGRAEFLGFRPQFAPTGEGRLSMWITPAYAQGAGAGGSEMFIQLLPFVAIFVIMYFLILRPQQKRVKQHQEMVKNLRRGDNVVTSGGTLGKVTKVVDDDQIEIEIADGIRVRQMKSMVSEVRTKGEPVKDEAAAS